MTADTNYVKCHRCGWLHFAVPLDYAQRELESLQHYLDTLTDEERESFGAPSMDAYMHCFKCGADSSSFVPATEHDAPAGATIQPVVVQR